MHALAARFDALSQRLDDEIKSRDRLEQHVKTMEQHAKIMEQHMKTMQVELETVKAQTSDLMQSLSALANIVFPIHIRALLDKGRVFIKENHNDHPTTWEVLQGTRSTDTLVDHIRAGLPPTIMLTRSTIRLVCSGRVLCQQGNEAAHDCSEEQIRDAVLSKSVDSGVRTSLQELFEVVFDVPL
ncbi:hypothetical protein FB451DRAFT_1251894 [Mycena latifolia]|nr:hypothetical protein FB451DRAFT_1251894 [Mycena latifolia]